MRPSTQERVGVSDFISLFPESALLFDYFKDRALIEKETDKNGKEFYWITINTRWTREYDIRINKCDDGSIYFGAWSTSRLVEPFETWHRGNDMADGKLCKKTIMRFIHQLFEDIFVKAPTEDKIKVCVGVQQDAKQ